MQSNLLLAWYLHFPTRGNSCLIFFKGKRWLKRKQVASMTISLLLITCKTFVKHAWNVKHWPSSIPQPLCQNTKGSWDLLPFHQKANIHRNSKDDFRVYLPVQKQFLSAISTVSNTEIQEKCLLSASSADSQRAQPVPSPPWWSRRCRQQHHWGQPGKVHWQAPQQKGRFHSCSDIACLVGYTPWQRSSSSGRVEPL